jgi:hypothetical protein
MPQENEILNCLINYTIQKELKIDVDILKNIILEMIVLFFLQQILS